MKILLLVASLTLVSCASYQKKDQKPEQMAQAKLEEMKKQEELKKQELAKQELEKQSVKTCSLEKDKRLIDIKKLEKGCEVHYTKDGQSRSIASAQNDLSFCDSIQKKVESNLSEAGFKCE